MAANEVSESDEERDDAAPRAAEHHGGVAQEHGDEEVEIGGEAEGEVGQGGAGGGGVEVLGRGAAGDVAPEEADGNRGQEAQRMNSTATSNI